MEHNISHQIDEDYLSFLKNLKKLSKEELIDCIGEYWYNLKQTAENNMKDNDSFRMEEYGRVKMTQVNFLRNLIDFKANTNED